MSRKIMFHERNLIQATSLRNVLLVSELAGPLSGFGDPLMTSASKARV